MRLLIVLLLLTGFSHAQRDSAITIPLIGINIGGHIPSADMAERFGPNLGAGGGLLVKTSKNWIWGAEAKYLFGRNVREDVLVQLKNPDGYVVDNEGFPADLRVTARGLAVHLSAGRLFNLPNLNRNSGIVFILGAGYLQHKIHLYDAQQKVAAVRGNLKRGYDRLSNGPVISQFLGYMYLSSNRLLNFYAGLDFYQGFTKSVRGLNYDTGATDTEQRLDIFSGIRLGWILPLYKRAPQEFYYY